MSAALDVLEAELLALRACRDRQQEALRLLGLYAAEDWARTLARHALARPDAPIVDALPASLYDRELAASATRPGLPHA